MWSFQKKLALHFPYTYILIFNGYCIFNITQYIGTFNRRIKSLNVIISVFLNLFIYVIILYHTVYVLLKICSDNLCFETFTLNFVSQRHFSTKGFLSVTRNVYKMKPTSLLNLNLHSAHNLSKHVLCYLIVSDFLQKVTTYMISSKEQFFFRRQPFQNVKCTFTVKFSWSLYFLEIIMSS